MKILRVLAAGVIGLGLTMAAFGQAGQDVKNAGTDTKDAAKDAGTATKDAAKDVGKGAKKVGSKVKSGTHTAARKVADKTTKKDLLDPEDT